MKKPIILAIDDDLQVLRAVSRDLRKQYKREYRVISTESANEALESLVEFKNQGQEVALFLSDQRMPEMLGVEFLEKARKIYPKAKRALLTAYSDTTAAIQAINEVQLDYYLTKPWDPPEEKMYPVLDDLLDDWQSNYVPEFEGIKVLGYQFSPKSHVVKDYLAANLFPYRWFDVETSKEAQDLIRNNGIEHKNLPAVIFEDGSYLVDPTIEKIAEKLGLNPKALADMYDVIIIGAGPAGLAASVYGSSEGLKTLLIERKAPGGQAGTSSRIENYLGFPTGLSGSDLTRRAISQATRLGTEFLTPSEVMEIKHRDLYKIIVLKDGSELMTKSIVITTGVDYRKLDTPGIAQFTGAGIYYGAATTEANACKDREVFVVGGGNSAGQGAMYLSQFAKNVYIMIRKEDLSATMSAYLIDQINNTPNIHLLNHSEIAEAEGSDRLEKLKIKNTVDGNVSKVKADALFIFIGAKPYTDWMNEGFEKDKKGFIITGRDLLNSGDFKKTWKLNREPYLLETKTPGVFAAGDVRSGAMNRVAAAVGEGAMSISFVHKYLEEV